jgi:hypothetical protein
MYLSREEFSELEKYIREEKCDKKENEKIFDSVSYEEEERVGYEFFPESFSEDDREKGFE